LGIIAAASSWRLLLVKALLVLFCTIMSLWTGISFAQEKTLAQLQTDFVSAWLVTVEGEDRTRTLRVTGSAQKSDATLLLEATYGWTDGGQIPIAASANQSGQQTTLQFTTQSGAQVAATQTSHGIFEGTFTDKKGATKAIKIQKISEDELRLKIASAKAAGAGAVIVKPAADVPASCASFSGKWTGTWHKRFGQDWLWVVKIDANCVAKFAYLSHPGSPVRFATVEIKDGALPIVNRSGGTSIFERHGDELWARYSNPSLGTQPGATNGAVFKKVE
jgi:hypothetical protein